MAALTVITGLPPEAIGPRLAADPKLLDLATTAVASYHVRQRTGRDIARVGIALIVFGTAAMGVALLQNLAQEVCGIPDNRTEPCSYNSHANAILVVGLLMVVAGVPTNVAGNHREGHPGPDEDQLTAALGAAGPGTYLPRAPPPMALTTRPALVVPLVAFRF